jgi:monovalent cation/hydrogen antiporter
VRPEEAAKLALGRDAALRRLALEHAERPQLALGGDHVDDAGHTQRADQLRLEILVAGVEVEPLHVVAAEPAPEPRPLQAACDGPLLSGVVERREAQPGAAGPEALDGPAHRLGAAHRLHGDAGRRQVDAAALGEREQRAAVARSFDEHDHPYSPSVDLRHIRRFARAILLECRTVHFGTDQYLQLLGLLAALGGLLVLAPVLRLPVPILLVFGGIVLGFVPGLPQVVLAPDVVLVAVLPPLLYSGAFFTSLRDLRANRRPIAFLAFGLVAATMGTVAVVAHELIDLPWAVAFTLGAIVAPTDALAATEIASRLGAPRRIVSIIEGESLVNDGTALVLYRSAVAAAVGGSFSLLDTSARIVFDVAGGIVVGLAVGWVVRQVRRRLDDPPIEVAIAVLSGYFAYLPAAAIGVSGVLAAVTIGVYMGWHTPELTNERTRLTGDAFWEILVFLVNALLFGLIGLQLRGIVDSLSDTPTSTLVGYSLAVSGTVILTRILLVPVFTYVPRWAFRSIREHDPYPPWEAPVLISWAGIRGAVSLAAALALPTDVPHHSLIVFLAFGVIVATLVLQGLTLPAMIRVLHVSDDGGAEREEAKARIRAAEAALVRLEELLEEGAVHPQTAERLRGSLGFRRDRFLARFDDGDDGAIEERSAAYQRVMRDLLAAEHAALLQLRNDGVIDDGVMQRVQRDLDLEAARLDQ